MTILNTKKVTFSTSIKGLFESLIDHTIIMDVNGKEQPLKDHVNSEMREALSFNFITVTRGFPFLRPIFGLNTSEDSRQYKGDCLPSIHLPTNETQLFAAGVMCAVGLTMEQLGLSEGELRQHAPHFSKSCIKYLSENEFDEKHEWLHHFYYGIRSIDWGSSEKNVAFYQLID